MLREEAPIWIRRRIKRHMAQGRDKEIVIRALMKHSGSRHTDDCAPILPDNVVPFPSMTRQSMPELRAA
jgi:hypothetical protein